MKTPIDILKDRIKHNEMIVENCIKYLPDAKEEVKRLESSYEEAKISIVSLKEAISKLEN